LPRHLVRALPLPSVAASGADFGSSSPRSCPHSVANAIAAPNASVGNTIERNPNRFVITISLEA
jgi:hypothetical protein